jgi:hypothetical protein
MPKFAVSTDVDVSKSRDEIERILARYGATGFAYGSQPGQAMIGFVLDQRHTRILMPLPMPEDPEFAKPVRVSPTVNRAPSPREREARYDQTIRQRWRALALMVKAVLEAVECGVTTLEAAFLSHQVMVNGQTVYQWAAPQLAAMREANTMPELLPGLTGRELPAP